MKKGPSGTPYQIVFLRTNDDRRHQTRCIYFRHIKKKSGYCAIHSTKCTGSTHCDDYRENNIVSADPPPPSPSIRNNEPRKDPIELIGEYMISPNFKIGKIIGVEDKTLYIKMTHNETVYRIGMSALENPKMGKWQAADPDIQAYILYLLRK